jgi:hypothetical protein
MGSTGTLLAKNDLRRKVTSKSHYSENVRGTKLLMVFLTISEACQKIRN